MTLDAVFAHHFASEWLAAWNSHDLPRVLALYDDDFEMQSPLITRLVGEANGTLHGKAAVHDYWTRALNLLPELHMQIQDVLLGANSLTLYYRSANGNMAAQTFSFNAAGKVIQDIAHYAVRSAG